MAWLILVMAGLLETTWATAMKYSHGFTRPVPSGLAIVASIASFILLGYAMKNIPLGTAYVVWTGIGAVGTITLGIILFRESANPLRLICLVITMVGLIGLKLTDANKEPPTVETEQSA